MAERIKSVLEAAILALLVALAGCKPNADTGRDDATAAERTRPERIITIGPNAAEILVDLGAADRIVGVSRFTPDLAPVRDKSRVGGLFDPNLERITALRPDLIILRGRNDDLESFCAQNGIGLLRDPTETIADIASTIRLIGRRVGEQQQAEELADRFSATITSFRDAVAGSPRPRVLVTISRNPAEIANVLTAGRNSFVSEMIALAGGQNVFADHDADYPQVSAEGMLAARPDVIIEIMPEAGALDARRQADLRDQWAGLGTMPAVRDGRIYFLTVPNALIPSPRYLDVIREVGRWLSPEVAVFRK